MSRATAKPSRAGFFGPNRLARMRRGERHRCRQFRPALTALENRQLLSLTTLASFNGTNGVVVLDAQGDLYGTTENGGAANDGTVFEIAAGSNTITTLASFSGTNGANPSGLVLDAQGDLYGTTEAGGANGDGTVFEIAAGSNTITTLASFDGTNGEAPVGSPVLDAQGNLYGTTNGGGAANDGTVFEIAAGSNTITTIASFNGTNGEYPLAGVVLDTQGNLYGTTEYGGDNGDGTVFEIAAGSNTITTIASFNSTNGAMPSGSLVMDAQGDLYGTTNGGGDNGDGTVFEIAAGSNTTITTLASFDGTNGEYPLAGVVMDAQGNLYGTTSSGGAANDGTVFEIAAGSNTITALASFNSSINGANPQTGVVMDAQGNLYGTTSIGGANGSGTVFEVAKGSNTITTLASFNSTNSAVSGNLSWIPFGTQDPGDTSIWPTSLVLDAQGNLYGTTFYGGANDDGTVFEVVKGSNTITTLASFNGTNGANPAGGLVLDAQSNLYGTTWTGGTINEDYGPNGDGTVFEVAKGSNTITTLAAFNGTNGMEPVGSLAMDAQGNLYGTTWTGGANIFGTVFEVAKGSNTITDLAGFNGGSQLYPSGVVMDGQGNLYGTTSGRDYDGGGVFELAKGSNTVTTIASFAAFHGTAGVGPFCGVVLDAQGDLYGTTEYSGDNGDGTVFEIAAGSNTITALASFNGTSQLYPSGVVLDGQGNLYGTTENGGVANDGTVFESPATPAITTSQQPATATVGNSIADQATVSGGDNPTGTVTFNLYNNSTAHRHAAVHRHRVARAAARPPPPATRRPPRAPTTGSPPTTAIATTPQSPAAPPPSR